MSRSRKFILALAAFALSAAAPAIAQVQPEAKRWFVQHIQPGQKLKHVEANILEIYRRLDVDMNGITKADGEIMKQRTMAQTRASYVARILIDDLDGDHKVTRAEVELVLMSGRGSRDCGCSGEADALDNLKQQIAPQVDSIMRADANGDGTIVLDEMFRLPEEYARNDTGEEREVSLFMSFDSNKDGTAKRSEIEAGIEGFFKAIDSDGNGVIDTDEYRALAQGG